MTERVQERRIEGGAELEREPDTCREAAGSALYVVPFQQTQAVASLPQAIDPASPSGLCRTQAAGPILMPSRRPDGRSCKAACAEMGYTGTMTGPS